MTLAVFLLPGSAQVMAEDANYCLCAKTTEAHSNSWDDQISYELTTALTTGNAYTLKMKVKATEACNITLWPIWNASENKNQWGGSTDVQYLAQQSVTTEWTTVTWVFTATYPDDGLDFVFGGLNGSLYLDDITLIDNAVGVNMVQNGDFAERSLTGWSSKSSYNGTSFSIVDSDSGSAAPEPDEPVIPDTWEYVEQGNPNFQIYLAFGQSNMEGATKAEDQDLVNVPERFKTMAAVNYTNTVRTKGQWYTAVPPLCREGCGLTPCDYFGRTLVENLPDSISVGVINVAVGGAKIELFMEEKKDAYIAEQQDWFKNICAQYNNDPFGRLVEMGKEAQKVGTIKGILLHQGESNCGESTWAAKVAKVYKRLCYYLGLDPAKTPLLAGETRYEDQGGGCSYHNKAAMPMLKGEIPNSYVISADGCTGVSTDAWHFSAEGYRELGRRYGQQMLEILKEEASAIKTPVVSLPSNGKLYTLNGCEVHESRPHTIVIENGVKKIIR